VSRARPVFFVLREDFLLLDLSAVVEPLRMANELGAAQPFSFHYVAHSKRVGSSCALGVGPVGALPRALPADAIVVLPGTRSATLERNAPLQPPVVAWLRRVLGPSHLLLCICSGALLAGEAGLLDGRECTTHHELCARLAGLAPKARVRENRIFVRDGNVFTSAGVTAGLDLTLAVLGLLEGDALALKVARGLVVYFRRAGEDPQLSPLLAHRNHLHPLVHRVQDAVVREPGRAWALAELARLVHVSERQLRRLFRECAGTTPAAWVALARVARARELLESTALPIERVAEDAGFGSARQFRRAFRAQLGRSPARWRGARAAGEVAPSGGRRG
jgi:transcriptional regulator GlxA family with amidase domain